MKCPYCGIDYNSNISFDAHIQNCFYRDNPIKKQENKVEETPAYEAMKYKELKGLAKSKGINTNKMKKEDLIQAIKELEG
ncbi:Rho termination factor N-terminal domain-containing protein [Natronincola ferrireducens]|uniref:Rho termination factor, N-terminal domain n=1 Tax=Natronincola ferrireducens TaxID=393762 RepID=A0A1G9IHJ9_9FIRM|nr:Rho termination factor N-terminal domain-containing protein [Natronincola ferrireducens]SDL24536.1 Rho termination factor, N-terminal domain [Natronincola ferrireducens]